MKLLSSLSFRLAVVYVLLFALSLCALIGLNYWLAVSRPLATIERSVRTETDNLIDTYMIDGEAALRSQLKQRERRDVRRKAYHALVAANGTVIVGNLPHIGRTSANGMTRIEADIYVDGDEEDHLALAYDHRFRTGVRLIVGRDIEDIAQHEELLAAAVPWTLGVSVFLGIIGGIVMSLAIGQRIDAVSRTARRVIAGDLTGRVPLRGTNDDFDRLGETFNLMLDRIEQSMEAVQRVSDHVAHELRTPLARAQMLLERIRRLHQTGDQDVVGPLLATLAIEGERLQIIFDALLRISRIETGARLLEQESLDLTAIVADAVELYAPAIEEKRLTLDIMPSTPIVIVGDSDLVAQAICNLIDNAIKYVPEAGVIEIVLAQSAGRVDLRICDNGPGIEADRANQLTERFFRGGNIGDVDGYGLGLSLVAAVAHAHGASLSFTNLEPGLCVFCSFPLSRGLVSFDPRTSDKLS